MENTPSDFRVKVFDDCFPKLVIVLSHNDFEHCETKQIMYHSKGIDENYPKNLLFIEFERLCQKLWAFVSNFSIFYDACSPNMAMSRDPRSKF